MCDEGMRALVSASRLAQGLPTHVEDVTVIAKVATLLASASRSANASCARSFPRPTGHKNGAAVASGRSG